MPVIAVAGLAPGARPELTLTWNVTVPLEPGVTEAMTAVGLPDVVTP